MEKIYEKQMAIPHVAVDRFGRMKTSWLLACVQEVAGEHSELLGAANGEYNGKRLFWAVTRHKVQISRLPVLGETIRIETWPMPTTRVAYPRSMVAYDEAGNEVFRSISLWVLMDLDSRNMILPGKSGISVLGTLRGLEPASPMGLPSKALRSHRDRWVNFTDLDRNGHMNNTRYLDWVDDLLPGVFHRDHPAAEFTVCYLSEAREGQQLQLDWDFLDENTLFMDAHRDNGDKNERVFAAKILFD